MCSHQRCVVVMNPRRPLFHFVGPSFGCSLVPQVQGTIVLSDLGKALSSSLGFQPRKSLSAKMSYAPTGMPILPRNVIQYSQVPKPDKRFTANTIPSGLLKQHNTKKGTWGVIRVFQGRLEYLIIEPAKSVHILDKDNFGVIEPTKLHQVKALTDDLEFIVEFWRTPGTGAPDEKREGLDD